MTIEQKTLIKVGHSAYSGTNLLRLCFSRAQAIRVLRNRGVLRDEAREVVARAMKDGGASAYGMHSQSVEVTNEAYALEHGWYMRPYDEIKRMWSKVNEF